MMESSDVRVRFPCPMVGGRKKRKRKTVILLEGTSSRWGASDDVVSSHAENRSGVGFRRHRNEGLHMLSYGVGEEGGGVPGFRALRHSQVRSIDRSTDPQPTHRRRCRRRTAR